MIVNKKHKHLQVHVPKTGGTSLREMLLKNGWEGLTYHSTLGSLKNESDIYSEYTKCVMIRNPWEHAVSYYGYLLSRQHFNIQDFQPNRQYKEISPDDAKKEEITFKGFINLTYRRRLYQSLYTTELEDIGLTYDKWFDYDKFEDMLNYYEKNFNINIERNIRKQDKRKINYVIDFDVDKPYQEYYDDDTYEIVKEVSKKEIEMFNYRF